MGTGADVSSLDDAACVRRVARVHGDFERVLVGSVMARSHRARMMAVRIVVAAESRDADPTGRQLGVSSGSRARR